MTDHFRQLLAINIEMHDQTHDWRGVDQHAASLHEFAERPSLLLTDAYEQHVGIVTHHISADGA